MAIAQMRVLSPKKDKQKEIYMSYYISENKISNADWLRSVKSQVGVVNGNRIDETDGDEIDGDESNLSPSHSDGVLRSVSGTISSFKQLAREGGNKAAVGLGSFVAALQALTEPELHMILMKIRNLIANDRPDIAQRISTAERQYLKGQMTLD